MPDQMILLYDCWKASSVCVRVLAQREQWKAQNRWCTVFAKHLLEKCQRWPSLEAEEDVIEVFCDTPSAICRRFEAARDEYLQCTPTQYFLFRTTHRDSVVHCIGALPPTLLLESSSQIQKHGSSLRQELYFVADDEFSWTYAGTVRRRGPFFIRRNQESSEDKVDDKKDEN